MGVQKLNLDIEMNFANLKFEIWNIKTFERIFLTWYFHFKCYGISMCASNKL